MMYRQLGTSDIEVSAVALGCWVFAGGRTWGEQSDSDSIRTVHAALDVGINFFDTAEGYGSGYSETILGRALEERRSKAVVATKVSESNAAEADVMAACDRSLQRLKTDYIDLYQLHWPSREVPLEETIGALERLQQQGKVRTYGVCNFGPKDLDELLSVGSIVSNQLPYNLLWRAIEVDIIPKCTEHNIGVLCYSPLAQALLTGKHRSADDVPSGRARTKHFSGDRPDARHGEGGREAETFAAIHELEAIAEAASVSMTDLAIQWLAHQPAVSSVLAGARRPSQIIANARSLGCPLPQDVLDKATAATEELKEAFGSNPDMWGSRFR